MKWDNSWNLARLLLEFLSENTMVKELASSGDAREQAESWNDSSCLVVELCVPSFLTAMSCS